jgi:hypothetical protein
MKTSLCFSLTIATLALVFSPASGMAAPAASTNLTNTASNAIPQSVFTIPSSKTEGCDPFFPASTRLWASTEAAPVMVPKQAKAAGVDCLSLKGLSGTPANPFAMINGRTMARGEDAEINTDCGRLLVHCVDITTNSAIVEVGGERRELHLRSEF